MRIPSSWQPGIRAAVSTAVPVVVGWYVGDVGAGLIASLGAFTARFGGDRPYLNRGVTMAVVAVSLASAVALGNWLAHPPWAGVAAVSIVGVTAVWLCNSLSVGGPGAYAFVLACAAGVGISAAGLAPWKTGLLVLAGSAVAWVVQMADLVTGYRGPERTAVTAAGDAVAGYVTVAAATVGPAASVPERAARLRAATALHKAWRVLIDYQPRDAPPGDVLYRLRDANHSLHVLFTKTLAAAARGDAPSIEFAEQARRLGRLEPATDPAAGGRPKTRDSNRILLTGPPVRTLLRRAVSPGSHIGHTMTRVAIGVPLAGAAALFLGLGHAYWAMAAAILVLHQGMNRQHTLRRAGELLVGTWMGLGLAGLILLTHPHGLWLAPLLAALQFAIAILAVRNYALAAVFITTIALTIASGTHRVDIGSLLVSRGTDILVGTIVGVGVYLVAVRFQESTRLTDAIGATLDAAADVLPHIPDGTASSLPARAARRDLQTAAITLTECEEAALAGSASHRRAAERLSAAVVAAEQVAYRIVSAMWAAEHRNDGAEFGKSLFAGFRVDECAEQFRLLAIAVRSGGAPAAPGDDVPPFVADEIDALRESLAQEL